MSIGSGRCAGIETTPAPNRLWVADLTYVSTWTGWVDVRFVIDAYALRILGWRVATTVTTSMVPGRAGTGDLEQIVRRPRRLHRPGRAHRPPRPRHLDPRQRTDRGRRDHAQEQAEKDTTRGPEQPLRRRGAVKADTIPDQVETRRTPAFSSPPT
jgi:transposase InsO family protein